MRRAAAIVAVLGAVGCGGDAATTPAGEDTSTQTSTDIEAPDRYWEEEVAEAPYFEGGGYRLERSEAAVVRTFELKGTTDGAAPGFDLDGKQSTKDDEASCFQPDLQSPDGAEGVDNQFAKVWDIVEPLVGDQVRALLQEAINEGRFLLIVEISDLDDPMNDDDVTLRMLRGAHSPKVGSSGLLLPSQTYAIDHEFPVSTVEHVALTDGVIEAGPIEVLIPVEVFDADFILPIEQGRVRLERQDDGTWKGLVGGQIPYGEALDQLLATNAKTEAELVAPFFEANADMDHTGDACEAISAGFDFTTTPAFVVRFSE